MSWKKALIPWLFCFLSVLMLWHPTLLSGFSRIQTDTGDSRFVNYLLEHSWQWARGLKPFWDADFFYPWKGQIAWAENLIGVAPIYWLFRFLGADHYLAFQLWGPSLTLLNFLAGYQLFRYLRLNVFPSSIGAWFFAACALRANQICHHQLIGVFYGVYAIFFLCKLANSPRPSSGPAKINPLCRLANNPRPRWAILLGIAVGGQLLAGWYLGWFLCFGLGLFGLTQVRHWRLLPWLLLAAVTATAVFAPVGWPMLQSAKSFSYPVDPNMFPTWRSWFDLGAGSWIYSRTAVERIVEVEHRIGLGFIAPLFALTGLLLRRRWGLLLACATLVLISTFGWEYVARFVPGANGLRAVARIGELLVFPCALGVAYMLQRIEKPLYALALLAALILEQGVTTGSFSKAQDRADIEQVAKLVRGRGCRSFIASTVDTRAIQDKYSIDDMWASMETGVPTFNGYSGRVPTALRTFDTRQDCLIRPVYP